jgi:hypothetical protein
VKAGIHHLVALDEADPYVCRAREPSQVVPTITGLLATAAVGAEHVGKEDVYAVYEMATSNPEDVGVTVLASIQRAFLENDRALQGKRRLTAATFGLLLLSALLIGLLNVGNQATLGLL